MRIATVPIVKKRLLASAAILAGLAQPVAGQETAAVGDVLVGEIVVTARRTAEKLQDVPFSLSALSADRLNAVGARDLQDVARQVPGFAFERVNGTLAQPVMRGQAQNRLNSPVQNVATFFNGIYLQRPYQVDSDFLGLDRVEILKGPQSALFGRNAFSGAISFVTKRPDLEDIKLEAQAGIGNYDRRELRGTVSVPIGGFAAISVAGSLHEFGGTWANNSAAAGLTGGAARTRGNLGGFDNTGFMVQARVKPFERLEINGFWNRRDIFLESIASYQAAAIGLISGFNVNNCTPFEAPAQARLGTNALICGALPTNPVLAPGEPRTPGLVADVRSFAQESRTDVIGASADLEISDEFVLSYLFGHTEADALSLGTLSRDPERGVSVPGPFTGRLLFDSRGNGEISSDSHEVRLSYDRKGLRLMLGGFASSVEDFDYGVSYAARPNTTDSFNLALFPAGDVFPPGFTASQRNERVRAIFGLASIEPIDGLRLTFEGRNTWERLRQQAQLFPSRTPVGAVFEREFQYFTPRFTVDYRVAPDVLVFANAARGVKSGGFNPNALLASERVFEPETNWSYEAGIKSTLDQGRLVLNAALFHVDWANLQANQVQTGGTVGTPLIIGNIAAAKVTGFEALAQWQATKAISINSSISYSNARYDEGTIDPVIPRALCQNPATLPPGSPPCPYNGNIGGRTIPRAPAWQANLGVGLREPVGNAFGKPLALIARFDAAWQSKQWVDTTNTAFIPERLIVDASIGIEQDNWSLRAYARNMFDRQYVSFSFATFAGSGTGSGVTYTPILGDRATFGLIGTVRY
jgi:iron complex outermembrane receptor protein